jgi:hypothetical protein
MLNEKEQSFLYRHFRRRPFLYGKDSVCAFTHRQWKRQPTFVSKESKVWE